MLLKAVFVDEVPFGDEKQQQQKNSIVLAVSLLLLIDSELRGRV